ncbi:hypothetical protein SERLA73DRAFT_177063 [Serpula lacrymans var. lacrymans S7.3]|uniref:Cytochrome P450 n=2 Tax=Serpula lacrymans var. lacrymans TaxID=341189 RepID=F8PQY7_SERL3|nr:uncharacterized protein SERLADRAFT_460478 [Serpula lacrymans var. lacrymans S7.9]EGO01644.1 hypothetical protein SERLA73DRAFT_177063 [Serpula lacrymans var. lacrymans S7.3]EGO27295.1 hypothetical protein SERLADRAFT_460478 [Serpula lacrymans var. lacrymans S7.9]
MIIVNSASVALEMLDKKSRLYSNRPHLTLAGDIVGWNMSLVLLQYGARFREYRKNLNRTIGTRSSMNKYEALVENRAHHFLRNVLNDPAALWAHLRMTSGSIILRIAYGHEALDVADPYLKAADTAVHYFSITTYAGAFVVDLIPFLQYLPDWFPGAGFKTVAKEAKESLKMMVDHPYDVAKDQIKAGTALPSFTSELLEDRAISAEEESIVKWSAQTLHIGGADTTAGTLYSFFLAMTLFPEVQKKAQDEIDRVIGSDRLPAAHDRESLPYINAIVLETLRWHCLVPLGVTHVSTEDDIHDGYFIPKGSMIVTNLWKMLHDPRIYKDPMEFNPERFIATEGKPAERDPHHACFGFGRRICPGILLAGLSIFTSCAMTLAVFDILKCTENGVPITPEVGQTTGTISHPKPFKCSINIRSAKALSLIQQEA